MREEVRKIANRFIKDLRARHPGIAVELLDEGSLSTDARVRVKCASHEQVNDVMLTLAQLTTDTYLDAGVYITGSAYHSGPLLREDT